MIDAFEFLAKYVDIPYLIAVLCLGRILSRDVVVKNVNFHMKALLLRVAYAYRVLIIAAALGILWYYMRIWSGNKTEAEYLIMTWLIANAFYDLLFKYLFDWIESKTKRTDGK